MGTTIKSTVEITLGPVRREIRKFSRSFTVIYATAPGKWALDGIGHQISPFAYSLQRRVPEQRKLAETYNLVFKDVVSSSKNAHNMRQLVQTFTCGESEEGVFRNCPDTSMSSSTILPPSSEEAYPDGSSTLALPRRMDRRCCAVLAAFSLLILAIFAGVCLSLWSLRVHDCGLSDWTDDGSFAEP